MTTNKHLKRLVRSRAARTGEPYATALRKIRKEQETRMSVNVPPTEVATTFCGKPSTEVERLVAGPGVFICNECIELALMVVENAASAMPEEAIRRRAAYQDPSTEDLLTILPALVKIADRAEGEVAFSASRSRAREADWHTIADAVGLSVEATLQPFGTAVAE